MNSTTYDQYFQARDVAPETYSEYTLPQHLTDVLPTDRSTPIFDIGCGYCQMLKCLRQMGFKALRGVDLSSDAVAHGLKEGLDVTLISDLKEFLLNNQARYELVVMSHVIEHIEKDQIINILDLIRTRLLTPSGKLYLATPNAQSATDCYWAYEDFTHTTLFTGGSMLYVLRRAGYQSITFLDPDGLDYLSLPRKIIKGALQTIYRANKHLWNRVMGASYHRPSPEMYSWELKVLAR
jgi:2-polyprenyl-3-methyl-5-hydroxy-6-metoxy-1,4-benzoquinol methylase